MSADRLYCFLYLLGTGLFDKISTAAFSCGLVPAVRAFVSSLPRAILKLTCLSTGDAIESCLLKNVPIKMHAFFTGSSFGASCVAACTTRAAMSFFSNTLTSTFLEFVIPPRVACSCAALTSFSSSPSQKMTAMLLPNMCMSLLDQFEMFSVDYCVFNRVDSFCAHRAYLDRFRYGKIVIYVFPVQIFLYNSTLGEYIVAVVHHGSDIDECFFGQRCKYTIVESFIDHSLSILADIFYSFKLWIGQLVQRLYDHY